LKTTIRSKGVFAETKDFRGEFYIFLPATCRWIYIN